MREKEKKLQIQVRVPKGRQLADVKPKEDFPPYVLPGGFNQMVIEVGEKVNGVKVIFYSVSHERIITIIIHQFREDGGKRYAVVPILYTLPRCKWGELMNLEEHRQGYTFFSVEPTE